MSSTSFRVHHVSKVTKPLVHSLNGQAEAKAREVDYITGLTLCALIFVLPIAHPATPMHLHDQYPCIRMHPAIEATRL